MNQQLADLIKVCQWMNASGLSPATSGNYSLRIDKSSCFVSASGVDKGQLRESDFIKMNLDGNYDKAGKRPSDEALIHTRIYQLYDNAQCILHGHSVANTVLSTMINEDFVCFEGLEMQKAFTGILSHLTPVEVKILDNKQEIAILAESLVKFDLPCFILRGHGVYAWGENTAQARRHLEGLEFLIACKLELLRLGR